MNSWIADRLFRRRVVLLQIIRHFSLVNVYTSSKTTDKRLVAPGCVVRIIVKVGLLPTEKGESLMLAAKKKEFSAISNFCSTVLQVVCLPDSLHAAQYTPIKDRP
ncbi:hypothetical protein ACX3YC_01175 [Pseudomonas mohnii]|jgi:hypothetical protein|uniref:hypothetical protein n=1 Tax=Pseudomonas sp. MIL9 TaxID=2807620 RepID=UPI0010290E2A|nr:hypothetical protein [Pseudomonas sp. MIL9]MBM6445470.1 hypothetical protein [Pseudomonas sp. MIL9]RZO09707.1 hypothetical protein EKG40_07670 [Pseudomonas moorei]